MFLERFSATAGQLTVTKGTNMRVVGAPTGLLLVAQPLDAGAWSEADPAALGAQPACKFPVPVAFKAGAKRTFKKRRYPRFFLCMDATGFKCGTNYAMRALTRGAGSKYAPSAWTPAASAFVFTPECDAAATASCNWGGGGRRH